jgi:hypothetical protein
VDLPVPRGPNRKKLARPGAAIDLANIMPFIP